MTRVAMAVVGGRTHEGGPMPERWARTPTAASTAMPATAPNAPARRIGRAHRMISPAPSRHAVPRASAHRGGRVLGAMSRTAPFTWTGVTSSARAENARRERPVADEVDDPRDAARRAVQLAERGGREGERADEPRDAEPVLDIARGVARGQRLEAAADADPLVELVQIPAPSLSRSSGWPTSNTGELLPRHVDRGQDADLLERLDAHLLGLVDDHDHAPALGPEARR